MARLYTLLTMKQRQKIHENYTEKVRKPRKKWYRGLVILFLVVALFGVVIGTWACGDSVEPVVIKIKEAM